MGCWTFAGFLQPSALPRRVCWFGAGCTESWIDDFDALGVFLWRQSDGTSWLGERLQRVAARREGTPSVFPCLSSVHSAALASDTTQTDHDDDSADMMRFSMDGGVCSPRSLTDCAITRQFLRRSREGRVVSSNEVDPTSRARGQARWRLGVLAVWCLWKRDRKKQTVTMRHTWSQ